MMNLFYEDQLSKLQSDIDLKEHSFSTDGEKHLSLVKKLGALFKNQFEEQQKSRKEFRPAGEWLDYNNEKSFLYGALANGHHEEASSLLSNFWRNKLGLIVKEYAKFEALETNDQSSVQHFKRSIGRNFLIWKDLFHLPVSALKLPSVVGNPWGLRIENELITPKAIRFHTNALQIKNLLDNTEEKTVAEIGGGYGGLALYLNREIKGLKYFNFDLPETLLLASYYLTLSLPDKKVFLYEGGEITPEIIKNHDIFMLPNYLIDKFPSKAVSVFFNSFSLSEMPPETNAAYINEISRITKSYFFHNNMDRKGVVNRGFERIPASMYPIDPKKFTLLSAHYDLFHGHFGDYKEFLYKVN
ncbi:MAG: putative sugar O-methyltransferase [Bacteroidota bacterium]